MVTRYVGRRSAFFFVLALICVLTVPATPPELRWVAWAPAGLAVFWGVLFFLEHVTVRGIGTPEPRFEHRAADRPPELPFQPPPSAWQRRERQTRAGSDQV